MALLRVVERFVDLYQMNRIHVIGASGSGKSVLAKQVADRLSIPYFATDPWFCKEGWITASAQEVSEATRCLFECDRYVMDGNFDHHGTIFGHERIALSGWTTRCGLF